MYPLEQYYLLQGGMMHNEDIHKGLESNIVTLSMNFCWNLSNSWSRAINLYWYFNYINYNYFENKFLMLTFPGISVSYIR